MSFGELTSIKITWNVYGWRFFFQTAREFYLTLNFYIAPPNGASDFIDFSLDNLNMASAENKELIP